MAGKQLKFSSAAVDITQQSTCTFVAAALGKELYTNLDADELRLMPIQNADISGKRIADICRRVLYTPLPVLEQVRRGLRAHPGWEKEYVSRRRNSWKRRSRSVPI